MHVLCNTNAGMQEGKKSLNHFSKLLASSTKPNNHLWVPRNTVRRSRSNYVHIPSTEGNNLPFLKIGCYVYVRTRLEMVFFSKITHMFQWAFENLISQLISRPRSPRWQITHVFENSMKYRT